MTLANLARRRALLLAGVLALPLAAAHAQDAAAGGQSFQQCAECHSTGVSNGAGPGLKGIVGRKAGSRDGFAYSSELKASGITWDAKTLDAFLAHPATAVPGNVMAFPGVDDAKDRADLIAYLASLK